MNADEMLMWFLAEVEAQGYRLTIGGLSAIVRMFEGAAPYTSASSALEHGKAELQARFGGDGAWLQPYVCLDDGSYPADAYAAWSEAGVEIPDDLMARKVIPTRRALDAFSAFVQRQGGTTTS